jgi:hypothetical protein
LVISFSVMVAVGPALVLDFHERAGTYASGALIVLATNVTLVMFLPELAELALGLALAGSFAARGVSSKAGRALLGLAGFVQGSLVAVLLALILSQSSSLRLAYSRWRPADSLVVDFDSAAQVIRAHKREHAKPPDTLAELAKAMRLRNRAVRYSTLRADSWLDPWGRPFVYDAHRGLFGMGWRIKLHSLGPDGKDDDGRGDDIAMESELKKWLGTAKLVWELD